MNCRAIIFWLISQIMKNVFIIVFVFSSLTWSQTSPVNWSRLQSKNMIILPDSSGQGQVLSTYPHWMQIIYTHILSWEPRVKSDKIVSENKCRLSFSSQNLEGRLSELRQFQKEKPDCIYLPKVGKTPSLKKTMKALSVQFDLTDTRHFRKVLFKLPGVKNNVLQVRGLFGIHDDQKARPLLILRMGVHGNVDEFLAERFIIKAAYEDFDFNFLALENLTSHGYLSQDNPITFGGIDEGLQTFLILKELKNKSSGWNTLISQIHLLGVSLGAHGVFLTSSLDEENEHYIKSATVFCPVVNLIKTLKFHSQANLESAVVDLWNHRRLKAVSERIAELDPTDWWKTFFDFKPRFMPVILNYLDSHQTKPAESMPTDMKWPKGLLEHLKNSKTFSEMNDFWPYYKNDKTPFLIVTTAKDILVSEEINADQILQKKQKGDFSRTKILQLDRGTHCGLPADYQWSYILPLLKTQWN